MTAGSLDYLVEWLHLSLDAEDNINRWQTAFDTACVAWHLDRAKRLLREAKRATLSDRDKAVVYHGEGMLFAQLGEWDRAVATMMRTVDILEDTEYVEDGMPLGMLLNDLGMVLRLQGNCEGAEAAHRQARELAETIEQPYLVTEALEQLGLDYEHRGDVAGAVTYVERALQFYRERGTKDQRASTLNHLGRLRLSQDNVVAARDALNKALELVSAEDEERAYLRAQIQGNLGNVCYETGDLPAAEQYWRAALTAFDAAGAVYDKVGLLNNLGGLAVGREDYSQARRYYRESLALAQALGDYRGTIDALTNLGVVYLHEDAWEPAVEHYSQALAVATEPELRRNVHRKLARVHALSAVDALSAANQGERRWMDGIRRAARELYRSVDHLFRSMTEALTHVTNGTKRRGGN